MKIRNVVLLIFFVCLITSNVLAAFGDPTVTRVGTTKPCPGDYAEYDYDSNKGGTCDDVFWNVYYKVGTAEISVPYTELNNGYRISVVWPEAAAGYSGYVRAAGFFCCWPEFLCDWSNADFTERLGASNFTIDGPELLNCGMEGNIIYDLSPAVSGVTYIWTSDGQAGISEEPLSGQGSDEAYFWSDTYTGSFPTTATITVVAHSFCENVPNITMNFVVTRSSSVPDSPTIGEKNYTTNSNENGLNTMTIQGNQTVSSGIKVNYRSDTQIRVIPSTVITAGADVSLKIGLTCEFPNMGARIAQGEEEVIESDSVVTASITEEDSFLEVFPNPSRSYTTIRYYIVKPVQTKLYVTDVTGRTILTLVKEEDAQGKGVQSFGYNTKNLKPGIYFCTLTSGSYYEVKRFVVIE